MEKLSKKLCFITCAISVSAMAGTMKNVTTHPLGWVIGGELGNGYLSSHEANDLNNNTTGVANASVPPFVTENFKNGYMIWAAHGGYDFSILTRLDLGLESGYKSMGQSTGSAYSFQPNNALGTQYVKTTYTYVDKQQAVDFLITGRVYLSDKWRGLNIIGKAGAAYVRSKNTATFDSVNITSGISSVTILKNSQQSVAIWRIEPEVNLGVGYSFIQHLDAHIMYTYIGGTDGNTSTNASVTAFNQPWQAVFAYNALSAGLSYSFE